MRTGSLCFQFLGIPPKGEREIVPINTDKVRELLFPISRDPPEGGTLNNLDWQAVPAGVGCFQFLGIPPKGERRLDGSLRLGFRVSNF